MYRNITMYIELKALHSANCTTNSTIGKIAFAKHLRKIQCQKLRRAKHKYHHMRSLPLTRFTSERSNLKICLSKRSSHIGKVALPHAWILWTAKKQRAKPLLYCGQCTKSQAAIDWYENISFFILCAYLEFVCFFIRSNQILRLFTAWKMNSWTASIISLNLCFHKFCHKNWKKKKTFNY